MEETQTQSLELIEPAAPDDLLPTDIQPWMWVAGVLVILIVIGLLVWKMKHKASVDPHAIRSQAYRLAAAEFDQLKAAGPREAAILSSLIIRKYLSVAAGDPALYETHEEFVSRHDSLNALTPQARQACTEGFARLAEWKYAPESPADTAEEILAANRRLLETLNAGFQNA